MVLFEMIKVIALESSPRTHAYVIFTMLRSGMFWKVLVWFMSVDIIK